MHALFHSHPLKPVPKDRQKETALYLKRVQHQVPSPFYRACAEGNYMYVEENIKTLSSDALDQLEPTGETALHVATRSNQLEIVRLLLQSGCSQNTHNSSDQLPHQEARTSEMKQLYARSTTAHFFEENPENSFALVKPVELADPSEQTAATENTVHKKKKTSTWNQEFTSEEEVLQYLTNRQTLALWIRFWAWCYRRFGRFIGRREEAGNDFAPELFELENDRDLEELFKCIPLDKAPPTIAEEDSPEEEVEVEVEDADEDEEEDEEGRTWRKRFITTLCCKNAVAPAPQPTQSATTDSVSTVQPRIHRREPISLPEMKRALASSRDPRDFIKASKQMDSITPLIYLYTRHDIPFFSVLNKKLATIENNPDGTASLCDRFIQEFDLKKAELSQFGFCGVTYRGSSMSASDVENYREAAEQNPKWIIAPRAFQSTSTKRSKAMEYLKVKKENGNAIGLLRFYIPEECSTILSVKEISAFPEEEEVLIMPGNLFVITKVEQCKEDSTVPEIHLEHVKRDISFFKKIRTILHGATNSATGID